MAVVVDDYMVPGSEWIPYLLEDTNIKGGYRVFKTVADRDAYMQHAKDIAWFEEYDSRKHGMLCFCMDTDTIYKLEADKETWVELELGGGTEFTIDSPLQFIGSLLRIDPAYLIPNGGNPGDVLTRTLAGTTMWQQLPLTQGIRASVEYTPIAAVGPGVQHHFDLELPPTIMILELEINTPDMKLEGWTGVNRDDANPYTFISSDTYLIDEGIKEQNGEIMKFRRFSFMANLEEPLTSRQYFTLTNLSPVDATPTIRITYLALQ